MEHRLRQPATPARPKGCSAWQAARRKRNDYRPVAADYRRVIQATRPSLDHAAVRDALGQHGYTHTVLMRLLDEARRGGVLPPALFA